MTGFDQSQSPRLGQRTAIESTFVRMFDGTEIPEAAWPGQIIYRTDRQVLQVFTEAGAWEDVISGRPSVLTFVGPTAPVSQTAGDVWFDSDDGYKLYIARTVGASAITLGQWELAQDSATAQATADSKNSVYYQDDEPDPNGVKLVINDVWVDTNSGNQMRTWDGSQWTDTRFSTGALDTNTITMSALTLLGNLDLRGLTNFLNGTLTLSQGVTDPGQQAIITSTYDTTDVGGPGFYRKGLTAYYDVARPDLVVTTDTLNNVSNVQTWSRVDGAASGAFNVLPGWSALGGVTMMGGRYYLLVQQNSFAGLSNTNWKILVYDGATQSYQGSFATGVGGGTSGTATITPTAYPAIGNDGTSILIADPDSGHVFVRKFIPFGVTGAGNQTGSTIDCGVWGASTNVTAIQGVAGKWYIGFHGAIYAYTTAGARSTPDQFPLGRADAMYGAYHDGTVWTTSHGNGRYLVNYTTLSGTWDFAYTWVDSDNGAGPQPPPFIDAQSLRSPIKTISPPKYSKWIVSLPVAPPDDGSANGANTAALYASPTGTPLAMQTVLAEGVTSQTYTSLLTSGTVPPVTSGFASRLSTAFGKITSTGQDAHGSATTKILGDGTAQLGPFGTSANGGPTSSVSTGVFTVATGWSITSQAARQWGRYTELTATISRTGADITVPASGNITNVSVGTLASSYLPHTTVSGGSTGTGRVAAWAFTAAGDMQLASVAPGSDITTGEALSFWLSYIAV